MAEQTQQEKNLETAKALIDKRAPLTAEQQRSAEIRAKRAESQSPSEVFSFMQESPIHGKRFDEVKEAVISKSDVSDPATPKRTGEEVTRAAHIDKYGTWLQTFDEKGFADLSASLRTTPDGQSAETATYNAVLKIAESLPQADAFFADMPRNEREAIVRELFNDPEFKAQVRKVISERTDSNKFSEELKDEVGEKRKAYKDARQLEDKKLEELTEIQREKNAVLARLAVMDKKNAPEHQNYRQDINTLSKQIEDFKNSDEKGKKIDEITLRLAGHDEAVISGQVQTLNSQLLLAQKQLAEARSINPKALEGADDVEKAAKKRELISAQEAFYNNIEVNKNTANAQLAAIRTLNQEKADLQQELKALEKQKHELERESRIGNINDREVLEEKKEELIKKESEISLEWRAAQQERFALQADYDAAKVLRESREQDVVEGLKLDNVFGEAAKRYYEEQWQHMSDAQDNYFRELEEKTTSKSEEALIKGLKNQWETEKQRRRGFLWLKTEQDKKLANKQIEADFNTIMSGDVGSVENVMRSVLIKGGLSFSEASQKVLDKDFVKEQTPQVVAEVVRNKLLTGKITPGEARYIFDTWGDELIPQQLERNQKMKAQLEELRKNSGSTENAWNWLKRKSDGNILQFILLLLGGTFTLGFVKFIEDWKDSNFK